VTRQLTKFCQKYLCDFHLRRCRLVDTQNGEFLHFLCTLFRLLCTEKSRSVKKQFEKLKTEIFKNTFATGSGLGQLSVEIIANFRVELFPRSV
jgi:hypothetical protein